MRAAKASRVDRLALLLGVHHLDEIVRPWQAAGMGGQKAVDAEGALGCITELVRMTSPPRAFM